MEFDVLLRKINRELMAKHADAWIVVDYENHHPFSRVFFKNIVLTRRLFIIFPKEGKPYIIAHVIDQNRFEEHGWIKDAFELVPYQTWKEMELKLRKHIVSYRKVLMDFVDKGSLQIDTTLDYGTATFIRSLGITLFSSADVLQYLSATIDEEGILSQQRVCEKLLLIKDEAFKKIADSIKKNKTITEYDVQQFICGRFKEENLFFDEDPIVAIGENAKDPHYAPTKEKNSEIREENLILIDMWAKENSEKAIYGDITWMGYTGKEVPIDYQKAFDALKIAIDRGIDFLNNNLSVYHVYGYQLDDVVRNAVYEKGYEGTFIHRTGHNIFNGPSPHGPGANIDNYETHDERALLEHTSFSIEPGIYTSNFGMRSETDVIIINGTPIVVGGRQEKIIALLKD